MDTRGRGELEAGVLRVLREAGQPLSAREIADSFTDTGRVPAPTTVLTVLDRLIGKGAVRRHRLSPRRQRFSAVRSAADDVSRSMLGALAEVEDRRAALLRFTGNLTVEDVDVLREALDERADRP